MAICSHRPPHREGKSHFRAVDLCHCLGLAAELRREWLSFQGVVDAQLDAFESGGGEWATGAEDDDDDDYLDARATAGFRRDGGVLSEADA